MNFLMVEQGLSIVESLSALVEEAFEALADNVVECDVFKLRPDDVRDCMICQLLMYRNLLFIVRIY